MPPAYPTSGKLSGAGSAIDTPLLPLIPFVFALASLGDAVIGSQDPRTLFAAFGLGLSAGGAVAFVFLAVFRVLYARRRLVSNLFWALTGAAFAVWLMDSLAAFERLHSAFWRMALIVIGVGSLTGAVLTFIGIAIQPKISRPRGWLFEQKARLRFLTSGGFALGLALLMWVDRAELLVTYPTAVVVIRRISLLFASIAAAVAMPACSRILCNWERRLWPLGLGLSLAAIIATNDLVAGNLMDRPWSGQALSALRWVLDADRDGYSPLLAGGDCDDFDSRVNPGAREFPNNGIDDNCLLGDAPTPRGPSATLDVPAPSAPSPSSVVYITADALNVKHTGLYGYNKDTTPNLDKWARERGIVFDRAYATGATTAIAFSSIFRGVYARRILFSRMAKTWGGRFVSAQRGSQPELAQGDSVDRIYWLSAHDPIPTFPQQLARRGMTTFAVTATHFAEPDTGSVGSFDKFLSLAHRGSREPDDEGATHQALQWMKQLNQNDRYFLWIHYLGTHTPTTRHQGVPDFGSGVLGGYDNEVATFDRRVAPLLAELTRRQRIGEPLVVVFSADHGEELGREPYHAHSVNEAVVRVPLVISLPGAAPRRVDDVASLADLAPTILSLCDTPVPPRLDGVDLSGIVRGKNRMGKRIVISDAWVVLSDTLVTNKVAATDGELRLIRDLVSQSSRRERAGEDPASGRPPSTEDVRHLKRALDEYIEQTGVFPF